MSIVDIVKKYGQLARVEEPQYVEILKSILKPLGCSVNFYRDRGILEVMGNSFGYHETINKRGESAEKYAYYIKNENFIGTSSDWIERFSGILKLVRVDKAYYYIPEDEEEVFLNEIKKKVEEEPFVDEEGSFQSTLDKEVVEKLKEKLELLL